MSLANPSIYLQSDRLLATKGKTFHWARAFLGKRHAVRATRLYGFCRLIDDVADDAMSAEGAHRTLAAIADDLKSGQSSHPQITDAIRLFEDCAIDVGLPLALIATVRSDLDTVRIPDEAALLRYCYGVAGTVGLMMSQVMDVDDPRALFHAMDLGIAMQITNICRDVKEDALMGRRYLPMQLVGDLDPVALINPSPQMKADMTPALRHLLTVADSYYASGMAGLGTLPWRARIAIAIAAQLYRRIGIQIRYQSYDVWHHRAHVSQIEKIPLSGWILFKSIWAPSFWSPRHNHDPKLHIALQGLPDVDLKEVS